MSRIPGMSRSVEYTVPSLSLAEKDRFTTELEPSSGSGTYGPKNRRQITWHVPAQEFIEPRSTYLQFDLQISAKHTSDNNAITNQNNILLDNPGGASIVRRLVLRDQSGKVIEEINEANLLSCFIQRAKGADFGASVGAKMTGFSPSLDEVMVSAPVNNAAGGDEYAKKSSLFAVVANNSVDTASVSKEYCIPLCLLGLGLMGTSSKTVPAKYCAKAGPAFIIDLYLEDATNVVVHTSNGTATTNLVPDYTVSNPRLVVEQVEPTLAFDSNFATAVQESPNGVKMFFKSYVNHSDQVTTQRHTSDFSAYEFSLNSAIAILRRQDWQNKVSHHSIGAWSDAGLLNAQARLGHQVNPVRPYEMRPDSSNARAYAQMLSTVGKICGEYAVDFRQWASGTANADKAKQFCLAFNWDKQEGMDDEDYVISGVKVSAPNNRRNTWQQEQILCATC